MGFILKSGIIKSVRPSNIGKGVWAKIVSQDLDDVARLFGSSPDDVIKGFAKSEVKGLFPKAISKIAYIGAFIDAGKGIKDNVDKGSSWERTASDALVDLTISGGGNLGIN